MNGPLTDPDTLQSFLSSHHIRASKSLGQNFLVCEEVVESVLIALQKTSLHITELGPGVGALTQALIGSGYIVRGIEKDDDFARLLPSVIPASKREALTVVHGDLTTVDWSWKEDQTNDGYVVVGNVPYNISGKIIRLLTKQQTLPKTAILLLQKEVANRIVHTENSMSLLGLATALWGTSKLLLNVPPDCFIPAPKVHSALIQITPLSDMLPLEQRELIIEKARPFFQAKRKQLGHTLKTAYKKTSEEADQLLQSIGISSKARPENLSPAQWKQLCDIL